MDDFSLISENEAIGECLVRIFFVIGISYTFSGRATEILVMNIESAQNA